MPSIWYEVVLHNTAEDLTVAGFSFPGAPGVIIGHNDRIGWGVTNLAPDVQDVYLERINPADPTEYRVEDEWRNMEVRTERIAVQGRGEPHVIRVRSTRNGPIITDLNSNEAFRGFGVEAPTVSSDSFTLTELSLRWTALEPNRTLESIYRLNRARSFDEFREALALFDVPAQNFVYADTEGNIGYQAPGLIPVRREGTGRIPAPGWRDEYQWQGYIPYEEMPFVFNPEKGYVATANNPVVPDSYDYLIATEFNHGYRAKRIVDLIEEAGGDITVEDVAAMHGDSYNILAAEMKTVLAELELGAGVHGRVISEARDLLLAWDGRMSRDSAGAALFAMFFQRLVENTFADQIPDDLWETSSRIGEGSRVQSAVESLLSDPRNRWWDDVRTPEVRERRDDILRRALAEAIAEGTAVYDAPLPDWRWGMVHTAEFRNQSLGESGIGIVEGIFNRGPVAVAGGMQQVLSADWSFTDPYNVNILSSMRQILDFADLEDSRMMHTTGQSGHPFHRNYDDMIDPWADVRYHPHTLSRAALEEAGGVRHLELVPAP
jgi:penicillin amidase